MARTPESAPANEDVAQVFAELINGMNRFLNRLPTLAPFANASVGPTEWSMLRTLKERGSMTAGQLAKAHAVSGQRANQLLEPLRKAGYIKVSPDPVDSRKKNLSVTEEGGARLKAINAGLTNLIASSSQQQANSIRVGQRVVRHLTRLAMQA